MRPASLSVSSVNRLAVVRMVGLALLAGGLNGCIAPNALPMPGRDAEYNRFRLAKDAPTWEAISLYKTPLIDGQLDPALDNMRPLTLVRINGDPRPPKAPTQVYVGCTKDALYVFFRCQYTDPAAVAWKQKTHDLDVWEDNTVEVFLDPSAQGGHDYFHLIVNPGGVTQDSRSKDPKAWEPKLQLATRVGQREWTAEMLIPFDQLGPKSGQVNKVWRANFTRTCHAPSEDTSWCNLRGYTSHNPDLFGYLWVDAGAVVNVHAQDLQPWETLPLERFDALRGTPAQSGGVIEPRGAILRLRQPLAYDDFVISADVYNPGQMRFLFARDPENRTTGCYATFINPINECNVALMRDWEFWNPLGGHVTIPQVGSCPMNDNTWYRCEVHFRPGRLSAYLNGKLLLETPNFYPTAHWLAIHASGECKLKNIRMRRLVE